jgi:hypothetical protein
MPTYRKLHTKVTQSFDFNEMPDDFTRCLWLLMPLGLDSEGRGIYNGSWIKAKLMPLREDITSKEIMTGMEWFASRKMIIVYEVDGRAYFYIPTFKDYQSGTEKEAKSVLPAPQELLPTNSGVSQEEVDAAASASASEFVNASEGDEIPIGPYSEYEQVFVEDTKLPIHAGGPKKWADSFLKMVEAGVEPVDLHTAIQEMINKQYTIVGPASLVNPAINAMGMRKRGNGKNGKASATRILTNPITGEKIEVTA